MFVIIEPSQPKARNVTKQFGHRGIPARTVTGLIAIGEAGRKRAWTMIMPRWLLAEVIPDHEHNLLRKA